MSNLSEFIGGGIKSVQTGSASQTGGIVNVTINAVNVNKSFIMINRTNGTSTSTPGYRSAVLSNSTTVECTAYAGSTFTTVSFTVVEYY
jgi:hypothetical protein